MVTVTMWPLKNDDKLRCQNHISFVVVIFIVVVVRPSSFMLQDPLERASQFLCPVFILNPGRTTVL